MVNSRGKLLKLALTLTRLSVQSSPQLLLKLSSQLSAARCTGKQVLRYKTKINSKKKNSIKFWTFWTISWDSVHIFQKRFLHWSRVNWMKFFLSYKGSFRSLKRKSTKLKFWKFYFISKCHLSIFQPTLLCIHSLKTEGGWKVCFKVVEGI